MAGGSTVAVISYKYWRERLAGDPAVVGTKIVVNNYPFTVIGVTPPEFFGLQPGQPIDVSVPLKMIAPLRPEYAMTGTPYDVLTCPDSRRVFHHGPTATRRYRRNRSRSHGAVVSRAR